MSPDELNESIAPQDTPVSPEKKTGTSALPASILIAAILIAGAIIYAVGLRGGGSGAPGVTTAPQIAGTATAAPEIDSSDAVLGDANAPVTVIEFGDYQCPFCAQAFHTVEPQLRNEYIKTGKVKMAFKDLAFLGAESTAAAEAARCAKDQSAYWAYHDALYTAESADGKENSGNLNQDLFIQIAGSLKLNTTSFAECLTNHKYAGEVQNDLNEAQKAGADSTPQFFVNGKKLRAGAIPYSEIKAAIDDALKGNS